MFLDHVRNLTDLRTVSVILTTVFHMLSVALCLVMSLAAQKELTNSIDRSQRSFVERCHFLLAKALDQ